VKTALLGSLLPKKDLRWTACGLPGPPKIVVIPSVWMALSHMVPVLLHVMNVRHNRELLVQKTGLRHVNMCVLNAHMLGLILL
jgi:hypothetical protein